MLQATYHNYDEVYRYHDMQMRREIISLKVRSEEEKMIKDGKQSVHKTLYLSMVQ